MKNSKPSEPVGKSLLKWLAIVSIVFFAGKAYAQYGTSGDILERQDSLKLKIGQMIMIGLGEFNSPGTNDAIYEMADAGKIGGVVLYEKNVNPVSPAPSLQKIIHRLQAKSTIPLFISIDEEGGRVNRLKPKYGFPATERASALGQIDNTDSTYYFANQTATTLHSLGINLNYAPNVDLNINPQNPVIGQLGRSYSSDPYVVSKHAGMVTKAHRVFSVGTVIKHFPGHGSSSKDSHKDMTDVTSSWRFTELLPYKALLDSGLVDAIMTAHIINEHLDPEKVPATLSKPIIQGILREFLGYQGVVFSDDMQMHAISKHFGLQPALKMAINAGVDVLMFANNVPQTDKKTAEEIQELIMQLVLAEEIPEYRIHESYDRIIAFKKQLNIIATPEITQEKLPLDIEETEKPEEEEPSDRKKKRRN